MIKCLLSFILFLICIPPYSYGGIKNTSSSIDLSHGDFDNSNIYTLQGSWTFTRGSYSHNISQGKTITVDEFLPWTKYKIDGEMIPAFGIGNYQTTIVLPKNAPRRLAIKITRIKTAYVLYINGKLVSNNGVLKEYPPISSINNTSGIVEFELPVNADSFHISIDVANHSYYRGGGDQPLLLGSVENITNTRNIGIIENSFIAGTLLIMGMYHILMWSYRITNSASLFFAVFSISYSIRLLLTGEKILYIFLPFLTEEIMLRLEIATAFIALPMMHIFISRMFPEEFNKRIEYFSWCIWTIFIVIAIGLPLFYVAQSVKILEGYVVFILCHMLYVGFKSYINKTNGARLFLIGIIGAFISGINDILFEVGYFSSRYISQYGVLLFIFVQSSLQSIRFSSVYSELMTLKNSLEVTVNHRTLELRRLTDELSRLSLATSNLLEEERKYITRELHDDLGQTISGLKLRAEFIGNKIRKVDTKNEFTELILMTKDIEDTLGSMYQRVRNMLRRLRPEIIDTMGLENALAELLSQYHDGYCINFNCSGDISKISDKTSIYIYRICQEAITNIVKYASASTITINLSSNDEIKFSIQDNGIGFDVNNPKGIGLISMRERILSLGGNLAIKSKPGYGTLIEIDIPF